jgi:fused signal recognition particle receptor
MFSFFKRKKSADQQAATDTARAAEENQQPGQAIAEPAEVAPAKSDAPGEPKALAESETLVEPESSSDPEAAAEPELAAEPEVAAESEVLAESVEQVEPEASTEPEVPTDPEATAERGALADAPAHEADMSSGSHKVTDAAADSAAPAVAAAPRQSWLSRLKQGLSRTGQNLGSLFVGVKVDENLFEELETALIMADAGLEATEKLLKDLRARVKRDRLDDAAKVKAALREILTEHLAPLEKPFPLGRAKPLVVMIAGVNGAGKTTSIGKLAHHFQAQGAKVLLAAGDTFRAAAREQLIEWGARNNVTVIAQDGGDPAAVAFDAVNAGRARDAGVVMVDTAGRLPTQLHLMEELKKIKRVIGKADSEAPHEVLLVVDGNTGQNAIAQIKAFDAAINLTGLVVTKLDGTAKGGTLAAVAAGSQGVRPVPVYWIGVGEGMHDLQPFVAREFASALLGDD